MGIFRQTETPSWYPLSSGRQPRLTAKCYPIRDTPFHIHRKSASRPLRFKGPQGPALGFCGCSVSEQLRNRFGNDLVVPLQTFCLKSRRPTTIMRRRPAAGYGAQPNAPSTGQLFSSSGEIQGSCISENSGRYVLLGVELRRIGLADSSQKVA
jgi:hypothetical protein